MHADDLERFEQVYNKCFPGVNRYLRYRVEQTWDADDLTASVFIKAFEKFHQCRSESSSTAWIFRIAHNVFVDYLTRNRLPDLATEMQLLTLKDTRNGPEEQLMHNEEVEELRRLLQQLPAEYRDVVALRYAGELRFAQIGEVLGKTEAAARTIHHRALKLLRAGYGDKQCRKEGGAL